MRQSLRYGHPVVIKCYRLCCRHDSEYLKLFIACEPVWLCEGSTVYGIYGMSTGGLEKKYD
jgi:hypothetical protein